MSVLDPYHFKPVVLVFLKQDCCSAISFRSCFDFLPHFGLLSDGKTSGYRDFATGSAFLPAL